MERIRNSFEDFFLLVHGQSSVTAGARMCLARRIGQNSRPAVPPIGGGGTCAAEFL